MDAESLSSAGKYLNNILLARGRLPQGKHIDFVQLAAPKDDKERSENVNATIRVINLIHSLILNADAQDEHNEAVASTLRELRADLARSQEDNERLERETAEHERQRRQAERDNAALQTQVQQAKAALRKSKEEAARVKSLLEQVRTQCAADIRRRDVQLEKLKGHLSTQQRGNRTAPVASSITITPGHTGTGQRAPSQPQQSGPSLADAEYSLTQESTQFLTQLCQDLSNENDLLLGCLKRTSAALKRTLQMPDHPQPKKDGTRPDGDAQVQVLSTSNDILIRELDELVENATAILTNPSFIPLEEAEEGYQLRDHEIENLREGWLKMEQRLRDAVSLMKNWRQRIEANGSTIDLDELKAGLGLGAGLAQSQYVHTSSPEDRMKVFMLAEREFDDDEKGQKSEDSLLKDLPLDESSINLTEELIQSKPETTNSDTYKEHDGQEEPGLQAASPNVQKKAQEKPKASSRRLDLDQENREHASSVTPVNSRSRRASKTKLGASNTPNPIAPIAKQITIRNPRRRTTSISSKRLKSSQTHRDIAAEENDGPVLTVPEKLRFAEEEARRVSSGTSSPIRSTFCESGAQENLVNATNKIKSPIRKSGMFGKPSRRRKSTLSPEELEELMLGPS